MYKKRRKIWIGVNCLLMFFFLSKDVLSNKETNTKNNDKKNTKTTNNKFKIKDYLDTSNMSPKKRGVEDRYIRKANEEWKKKVVKVAFIAKYPPLIYKNQKGETVGVLADLWKEVAKRAGLKYEITPIIGKGRFNKTILMVENNKFDIAVGSFAINSARERLVDFSRPYYISSFGLAIPKNEKNVSSIVFDLFGNLIFMILTIGLSLILIFSFVLWKLERKKDKSMKGSKGFGLSVWITVTCFLRDLLYTPKTIYARILVTFWLVISAASMIILTSTTTSILTYSLTLADNDIKSLDDLKKKKVITKDGSALITVLSDLGVKKSDLILVSNAKAAIPHIDSKKGNAIFATYLELSHLIENDPEFTQNTPLVMASYIPKIAEQGWPMPKGSSLIEIVNRALKSVQTDGTFRSICAKYLQKRSQDGCHL